MQSTLFDCCCYGPMLWAIQNQQTKKCTKTVMSFYGNTKSYHHRVCSHTCEIIQFSRGVSSNPSPTKTPSSLYFAFVGCNYKEWKKKPTARQRKGTEPQINAQSCGFFTFSPFDLCPNIEIHLAGFLMVIFYKAPFFTRAEKGGKVSCSSKSIYKKNMFPACIDRP